MADSLLRRPRTKQRRTQVRLRGCLFARGVYSDVLLAECLKSVGYETLAGTLGAVSKNIQQLRWKARLASGYRPEDVSIPKRFLETTTGKGPMDAAYLTSLKEQYAKAIRALGSA